MMSDIPRDAFERQYLRARVIATGLLICMAGLFVISLIWEQRYPALRWVRACGGAAMVGALADWYAVTALFRRPLGLPIPHPPLPPRTQASLPAPRGPPPTRQH